MNAEWGSENYFNKVFCELQHDLFFYHHLT